MKDVSITASYQLFDATSLKVRGPGTLVKPARDLSRSCQFHQWGLRTYGKSYQTPSRIMGAPGIMITDTLNKIKNVLLPVPVSTRSNGMYEVGLGLGFAAVQFQQQYIIC